MPELGQSSNQDDTQKLEKQPQNLCLLLRSLSFARRLSSLYSADHPSTVAAVASLANIVEGYILGLSERSATCVFTRDAIIVNDRTYRATFESCDMYHRLRARGVMAITLLLGITDKQIARFMDFLNVEPGEVNIGEGPREYLRRLGVTRIVATEAIYTGDEESEDESDHFDDAGSVPGVVDHAIGAVIDWLSRQEDDRGEDAPLLPVIDILSDPDMAARLIREAVTKLQAARTDAGSQELASEVVNDLKDMASGDRQRWDEATPQIRKAIAKLPSDIRPIAQGFTAEQRESERTSGRSPQRIIDINDLEVQLADALRPKSESLLDQKDAQPIDVNSLFGAKSEGMLSTWRSEIQPMNILRSCGRTYETLMAGQGNASEHGRIARALARLILRAVEIEDITPSLLLAEDLIKESKRDDGMVWRRSNAIAALESVGMNTLQTIVQRALSAGAYHHKEIASQMVENVPNLALSLIHLLGVYRGELFDESLKRGLAQASRSSPSLLATTLRTGNPPARMSALETLIDIASPSATKEISDTLDTQEEPIVIRALALLPAAQTSYAADTCIGALTHRSSDVRCAAITALGVIGGDSVLPHIIRIVTGKSHGPRERIRAVDVLGEIGRAEDVEHLQKIVDHRPIFGRKRYEGLKSAASSALTRIHERQAESADRAAL